MVPHSCQRWLRWDGHSLQKIAAQRKVLSRKFYSPPTLWSWKLCCCCWEEKQLKHNNQRLLEDLTLLTSLTWFLLSTQNIEKREIYLARRPPQMLKIWTEASEWERGQRCPPLQLSKRTETSNENVEHGTGLCFNVILNRTNIDGLWPSLAKLSKVYQTWSKFFSVCPIKNDI